MSFVLLVLMVALYTMFLFMNLFCNEFRYVGAVPSNVCLSGESVEMSLLMDVDS